MIINKLEVTKKITRPNFHLIKYGRYYSMILFLDGASIELEDATDIIALKETLYEPEEEMVVFARSEGMFNVSKEAMKLLSNHPTPNNDVISTVLIVENLGLRLVANFYVNTVKPSYPIKIVRTFEKAVQWSSHMLKDHFNQKAV